MLEIWGRKKSSHLGITLFACIEHAGSICYSYSLTNQSYPISCEEKLVSVWPFWSSILIYFEVSFHEIVLREKEKTIRSGQTITLSNASMACEADV